MKTVFAPGCALFIHNIELAEKISAYLRARYNIGEVHETCCHHDPNVTEETKLVCVCSGCIRRYDTLYYDVSAISLWELIDRDPDFNFPDYGGMTMTVLDACPTRLYPQMHDAVRSIMEKMNIKIVEPARTGSEGKCCGDSFYGVLPKEQVIGKMCERGNEMPAEDVAVYCVSCVKAMKNGGKTPRYLPDLLFGTDTPAGECDPDAWHAQVDDFIEKHQT
ncbi:MAG: (Fe-S)-binding protein [Deferribacterales bacterium]